MAATRPRPMPSSVAAMDPAPVSSSAWAASATHSRAVPSSPRAAASCQRRVSRRRSRTRSMTADASGAVPMETTVPTATRARCIEV
ncbi:hypothetical protein AQJ23_43595 [Streptomyces antibioticus]|nr:hypothetical protein AQJ23_43595 [Streptomyces antibioticus]